MSSGFQMAGQLFIPVVNPMNSYRFSKNIRFARKKCQY